MNWSLRLLRKDKVVGRHARHGATVEQFAEPSPEGFHVLRVRVCVLAWLGQFC